MSTPVSQRQRIVTSFPSVIPGLRLRLAASIRIVSSIMLESLPCELGWRVLRWLDPQDIGSLFQTSKTVYELASSNEVWRDRVRALFRRHAQQSAHADELDVIAVDDEKAWLDAWAFIGGYRYRLGYWASGGRILRVSAVLNPSDHARTLLHRLSVRVDRFEALNGLALESAGDTLPRRPLASFWDQPSCSYMSVPC